MATKAEKGRVSIMTKQQKKTLNLVLTYLVIILIGCVLLFPIAWMISAAFKTNDEIFGSIALMPKSFSFQNFIDGWKSAGIYTYATYFINSFIMVIPTTLLTIASSALVAYGFARFNFPFKKQLFAILIATLMLPNSVIIIPRYVLFNKFGWVDSYMPFWVPALLACYPFFIYQLIQFMRGIPDQLGEAAKIDGANKFRIYWQIVMPLCLPIRSAMAFTPKMDLRRSIPTMLLTLLWRKCFAKAASRAFPRHTASLCATWERRLSDGKALFSRQDNRGRERSLG